MKDSAYKKAGVDIDAGEEVVSRIRPHVKSTVRSGVMQGIGGFGAFFDLKKTGYQDPVLVAATDGVGTKLKLAIETGCHDSVGIDLVAMCVNDLVVQGAEPLFFLDYYATGKLEPPQAEAVIAGIAAGCRQANCALIGGETAEMPGMYKAGDYDLAGFAVGAVERQDVITGQDIASGDVVLGLASSGLHSNGFSLVRKICERQGGYDRPVPFAPEQAPDQTLGMALMSPTRIYVPALLAAMRAQSGVIKGLAHITGGGLYENIPRILPEGLAVRLDTACWSLPAVFGWLATQGALNFDDLARTFNCGIGMVVICRPEDEAALIDSLRDQGESVYKIGRVEAQNGTDRIIIERGSESRAQGWPD